MLKAPEFRLQSDTQCTMRTNIDGALLSIQSNYRERRTKDHAEVLL
jgi:hypothetical protein